MKTIPRIAAAVLLLASACIPAGCASHENRFESEARPGAKHHGWTHWEDDHYEEWWQSVMK
jgi:hypothetical protein